MIFHMHFSKTDTCIKQNYQGLTTCLLEERYSFEI